MSGICTVDIMAESHSIIPSLNMFAVGTAAGWTDRQVPDISEENAGE